ncbi:hypothetical protein DRN84_00295 [Candidatus Geothermarchaeota archaeon]|nr:MAG: hypothetical protein DRN87_00745 [Candidatus Geothermarchaeota archaeon]RLG63010.1 MAG: hypothetical protein DRN84_00295 [Candidatus Geothermarchaeota archaeon]HEW93343.1 DUF359 domain-containing protein [Thermoprotei archaeon]
MQLKYFKGTRYIKASKDVREKVSAPLGKLYRPDEIDKLINDLVDCRRHGLIASVGDRVTYTLIENNLIPDIAVIDGKERRREVDLVDLKKFNLVIFVENKPGYVNIALVNLIRRHLKDRPILLYVKGEEDLVGFPIVFACDVGSCMIYGQPNIGIVLINIDDKVKYMAASILGLSGSSLG